MATFIYKAKKSTAETVTGVITADTQDEAIDLINQLGLLPVAVQPQVKDEAEYGDARPQKISGKDLFLFSRQLASLLKSGVTILRALGILETQTQNKYFKKIIAKIGLGVKNGRSFSECLGEYPKVFSPLYITMIRAGEEGGSLREMLGNIAIYEKKQEELFSKIRLALAYPMLMLGVGVLTVYFILTFVLPKMSGLFKNLGNALPLPTAMLLNLSHTLKENGLWFLIGGLVLVFMLQRFGQLEKGRVALSGFLLSLPLFGEIVLKAELSRFSRTLVLLLKGGVPILRALEISIPILSNEIIKKDLTQCKQELAGGGSLGESIKRSPRLPLLLGYLIAVGEESGSLNEVLSDIADTYEQETDEKIKLMTTLFEPMMIMAVGLVIGFIVFAMLLPIFELDVLSN